MLQQASAASCPLTCVSDRNHPQTPPEAWADSAGPRAFPIASTTSTSTLLHEAFLPGCEVQRGGHAQSIHRSFPPAATVMQWNAGVSVAHE